MVEQTLEVKVTTAIDPGDEEKKKIAQDISRLTGKDPAVIEYRVDPEIIAGIVIRIGDRIIDGSARNRLTALKHLIVSASA